MATNDIRGGDQEDKDFYTAVGVQIVVGSTADAPNDSLLSSLQGSPCMILQGDACLQVAPTSSRQLIWKGDRAALESLAICCDVMVIVVVIDDDNGKLLDADFCQALERGLRQRADQGLVSSILILLVSKSPTHKASLWSREKDVLLLQDLSSLTPSLVSSLDLLSLDDPHESTMGLATVWRDILQDLAGKPKQTTSHLVSAQSFSKLLVETYQSKGGSRNDFMESLQQQAVSQDGASNTETTSAADSNSNTMVEDVSIAVPVGGGTDDSDITSVEDASIQSTGQQSADSATEEEEDPVQQEERLLAIFATAKDQIRDLETQQEQLWLGFSTDDLSTSSTSSLLEFGSSADKILEDYERQTSETVDESLQPRAKEYLWQRILPPLKQVYDQHLQFLREQYGKRYEAALEQTAHQPTSSLQDHQHQWKEAAAKVTAAFREAAQGAVPTACQPGGSLRDANFDYVPTLEGLLTDMMQATEEHEELMGMEDEDSAQDDAGVQPPKRGKRPAKWYEKIAAKAFVFAVNYFQGWLAYQGLKRAAAQRDEHLPKFPLF